MGNVQWFLFTYWINIAGAFDKVAASLMHWKINSMSMKWWWGKYHSESDFGQ